MAPLEPINSEVQLLRKPARLPYASASYSPISDTGESTIFPCAPSAISLSLTSGRARLSGGCCAVSMSAGSIWWRRWPACVRWPGNGFRRWHIGSADQGMLEFVDNPNHKRARLMRITAAGRSLLGQIAAALEPRAATMQREFDERELRRTLNTLRKLRERLIAEYRR